MYTDIYSSRHGISPRPLWPIWSDFGLRGGMLQKSDRWMENEDLSDLFRRHCCKNIVVSGFAYLCGCIKKHFTARPKPKSKVEGFI